MASMDPINCKLKTISFFIKLDVSGDSIFVKYICLIFNSYVFYMMHLYQPKKFHVFKLNNLIGTLKLYIYLNSIFI